MQWAQNLNYVFIEVRYAHRHDAPGCSRHEDEQITIKEDFIEVQMLCIEANAKVKYRLQLQLFEGINVTLSKYEYQAVGKYHFTLAKLRQPGRWL